MTVVDDGGAGVPVTTEECREVRTPTEDVVIGEEVDSSDEESGEAVSDRWRVWPRGGEPMVMTEWGIREAMGVSGSGYMDGSGLGSGSGLGCGSESGGAGGNGDGPKGKRVAVEEPMKGQGPVGIFLGDYAIHADPKDVAALGWEALEVLDVVREEVIRGGGERETAVLHQAALEVEAEAEE